MSQAARHLYVHVPFCARRCSYCDFAIAVRRDLPVRQYLDALAAELSLRLPVASVKSTRSTSAAELRRCSAQRA